MQRQDVQVQFLPLLKLYHRLLFAKTDNKRKRRTQLIESRMEKIVPKSSLQYNIIDTNLQIITFYSNQESKRIQWISVSNTTTQQTPSKHSYPNKFIKKKFAMSYIKRQPVLKLTVEKKKWKKNQWRRMRTFNQISITSTAFNHFNHL